MSLSESVVVVTGASSGIGRCAARMFAERGASVVLAARRGAALEEAARECRAHGGLALAVPTDMRDEEQVEALARRAIESFGRIDVWVNNAAVSLLGRFEETPPDVYDGVIRTNLFGYVHGARAVLPLFRERGRGVLVNVASVVSYVGQPYTSAYVATKHAIRGWSECLRMELTDAPDIHVCTVLPASIDTPIFQHAGNYTGRAVKPMEPVYPAEIVGAAIVGVAERPRREVLVGAAGGMLVALHTLAPGLTERLMARMVDRHHLAPHPAPPTPGNVLEPMPEWTGVGGNWRGAAPERGPRPAVALGLLLLAGLPLAAIAWRALRTR